MDVMQRLHRPSFAVGEDNQLYQCFMVQSEYTHQIKANKQPHCVLYSSKNN